MHTSIGFPSIREIPKRLDSGQEEISTASYGRKRWYSLYLPLDGPLRNRNIVRTVLRAEDWIALVSQLVEIRIIGPDIHGKFKLTHEAGAADKSSNPALNP